MTTPHFVMWHVAEGHLPALAEAAEKLAHLEARGPTELAFGWEGVGGRWPPRYPGPFSVRRYIGHSPSFQSREPWMMRKMVIEASVLA